MGKQPLRTDIWAKVNAGSSTEQERFALHCSRTGLCIRVEMSWEKAKADLLKQRPPCVSWHKSRIGFVPLSVFPCKITPWLIPSLLRVVLSLTQWQKPALQHWISLFECLTYFPFENKDLWWARLWALAGKFWTTLLTDLCCYSIMRGKC